jgi:hypothetical protein
MEFQMTKTIIAVSVLLASMLSASAFAQTTRGEVDESGSKAQSSSHATKAEKAEAKAARKAEGKAVAKQAKVNEGDPTSMGASGGTTKAERQAAAKARRAATAEAVKKGEVQSQSGEK